MLIGFDLLDRQIVDRDGQPVGKVDDVELSHDADGVLRISALLTGERALGRRIGGRLGRWIASPARRLAGSRDDGPLRIGIAQVGAIGSAIDLTVSRDELPEPALETWLRDHLIGRIPGAGHES
ncbi:hypothetical protein COUCH_16695 [Couchioplanes caeruleus]|uniref:hypothetical protein n=1 Tax=Couchioplanes caeruleus TaxID=56438 RepID=UPI0020C15554|nr:hypothetical protein [Couchioplanes caeruleus]UQU67809.1 hypothetical protein COUCH_16695 [Couchioplanes caeruleus]